MKLGNLKPSNGSTKNTKRLGRGLGTGWGKTAGRGNKGAGQRSGNKKRAWFEGGQMPLARRLPKRGFSNYRFKKVFQIVNLSTVEKLRVKIIDNQVLKDKGVISTMRTPVKILGDGDFSKKINITADAFSKSTVEKIEKAGGKVIVK